MNANELDWSSEYPGDLREANRQHDAAKHEISMDPRARVGSRSLTNVVGRLLTDRDIAKYERQGYYTSEFKEARRELMERKAVKRKARETRREGNFLVFSDGHKVYSPQ